MADISLHHTLPSLLSRIESARKAYTLWQQQRRADADLRAAVDRLAALSPHYLDDIGIATINTAGTYAAPPAPAYRA
jgi:uncharacterized protein YjiS (DUF1127 family)